MYIATTPFYIEVLDAAGKEASGYLGTVGAGLTLGPELIINGGMEAGDPPTGWDAVATPETFERSGVQKKSGSYSLHLVDSVPSYGQGRQYFPGGARVAGAVYTFLFSHHTITGPLNAIFSDGNGVALGDVSYADLAAWFDRTTFYAMTVDDGGIGFVTFYHAAGGALEFYLDDVSVKRVTEPPATAVHIVSAVNGMTRNWASIEAGFDPSNITSWKIYDLAHPGFYLPSDGSTFNRGDFKDGNAFFWSSIDLSPYAGTLTASEGWSDITEADQSDILKALKSAIPAAMKEIKAVHVLPDPDLLPESAQFPCVGLKDGDSDFSEGMDRTEVESGSVLVYVYVQILKEEASIMGEGSKKGVLRLIRDLRTALNQTMLGGLVKHFYSPEVMASETMFKGEDVFVQRKGCRFIYQR
jgi:hypothetical protein